MEKTTQDSKKTVNVECSEEDIAKLCADFTTDGTLAAEYLDKVKEMTGSTNHVRCTVPPSLSDSGCVRIGRTLQAWLPGVAVVIHKPDVPEAPR